MTARDRRKLFAKIATGDWDAVIVPHSSFRFIGVSPETEMRFLKEELRIAMEAIEEAKEQAERDGTAGGVASRSTSKRRSDWQPRSKAGSTPSTEGKRDRLLTFEQMGVDDLTVDEAHEFKNLFYSSLPHVGRPRNGEQVRLPKGV